MNLEDKQSYLEKAIAWAQKKSNESLRSISDGYEDPKAFTNKSTNKTVQADISFRTRGGAKHYTDIALKNDNTQQLVTRWKLLSLMASMKNGKLHLLTPRGHKMFTQRLVNKYNIEASIHSL